MAIHNPVYYNAAMSGALAGMFDGRVPTSPTAGDYASPVAAALAFATEVDALIPADVTVEAAGATIAGSAASAAQTNALTTRPLALHGICKAVWTSRVGSDTVATDYAALGAAVAALFAEYIAAPVSNA